MLCRFVHGAIRGAVLHAEAETRELSGPRAIAQQHRTVGRDADIERTAAGGDTARRVGLGGDASGAKQRAGPQLADFAVENGRQAGIRGIERDGERGLAEVECGGVARPARSSGGPQDERALAENFVVAGGAAVDLQDVGVGEQGYGRGIG